MKIVVRTKDDISNFKPRDIRNYIASISSENDEKILLSHKHTVPELIYVKPYLYGFNIIDYRNRMDLIGRIMTNIKNNTNFYGTEITNVVLKNYQYTIPVKQTMSNLYYTRTPLIMQSNKNEHHLLCAIKNNSDEKRLKQCINDRLNRDIQYQMSKYFNIEYQVDVNAEISQCKQIQVRYKPDITVSAVLCRFRSNYILPEFLGYGTGLGWGQIVKEKVNRVS